MTSSGSARTTQWDAVTARMGGGSERERGKWVWGGKNKFNPCIRMLMKTATFVKIFDRFLKILFIRSLKKNKVLDLGIKFLELSR